MPRRVMITGLGPLTGLGRGRQENWTAVREGRCAIERIVAFDPAGMPCQIAAEVRDFSVRDFVPKSYRKATKVMARDIELAVAAADLAARDAGLVTSGTAQEGQANSYPSPRMGAQIGAGLIAADINELTDALATAKCEAGAASGGGTQQAAPCCVAPVESTSGGGGASGGVFDIHKWGQTGMEQLTPLWLLKYLPNMLACHVTIIHDAQGPSNTITCGDSSAALSIGESLRVIQRGSADVCFCGGAESRLNPMAFIRQVLAGRLNAKDNAQPGQSVRPFCQSASGTVLGEGGAIVILESQETLAARGHGPGYAEVVGFGASQSVDFASRNRNPDPQGKGLALAIQKAMREAGVSAADIDLIVPYGSAIPEYDRAEAAALRAIFGPRLSQVAIVTPKTCWGNCGAGGAALDVCVAALALKEQVLPAVLNRAQPLEGIGSGWRQAKPAALRHALVFTTGLGGQNAALVLRRVEG